TGFTSSAGHVKTETPGFVSANHRFGSFGKKIPYFRKNAHVCSRIASRGSSDGGLVYVYYFINMLKPFNFFVRHRFFYTVEKMRIQNRVEGFIDERAFSAARNTGNTYHFSQWKFY